jgi:ABC-type nitrate/sulfonate/bicarbonate transport system substrate-binding protein
MSMIGRIYASLSALILICITANWARAQAPAATPAEKIMVSYPSKSITSFPILETARQKGFFQREGLNASIIYVRGGIDIKALVTGDVDYALASTTSVTAFVAGMPVRVIMSYNAHVDQGLFAQPKYRTVAQLKGQPIGSLNPGGLGIRC